MMRTMNQIIKETDARRILNAMKAYRAATVVEATGWFLVVAAPIVGILVSLDKEGATPENTYPNVLTGVIIGVVGLICSAAIIMAATYVKSRVSNDSIISVED